MNAARRVHGARAIPTVRRARALRRRGFRYDEALALGLLDPAMPEARWRNFVSDHENTAIQRRLNGEDSPPVVTDKVAFGLLCRALGIPAPELLAVVHAEGDGWSAARGVLHDERDWRAAAEAFPQGWVVKPADGFGGAGVRVLARDGRRLREPGGGEVNPGALWRRGLRAGREHATYLVQERLRDSPRHRVAGRGRRDAPHPPAWSRSSGATERRSSCGRGSSWVSPAPGSTTSRRARRAT